MEYDVILTRGEIEAILLAIAYLHENNDLVDFPENADDLTKVDEKLQIVIS